MKLTEEFLWSKIKALLNYWEQNNEYSSIGRVYRSMQLYETENGNYNFIIYNLCGFLNGHFLFTVNPDTFEYAIQMESYYGGLTWTTPPTENKIYTKDDLPDDVKLKVEAYIAYSLCLCFYDKYYKHTPMDIGLQRLVRGNQFYPDLLTKLT